MKSSLSLLLFTAVTATVLTSCKTMSEVASSIPKPKLPDLGKLIPGGNDTPAVDDPAVPFSSTAPLGYGHTLHFRAYEGTRVAKKLFDGKVMVDEKGVAQVGDVGSAKLGGHKLPEVVKALEGVFRVAGKTSLPIQIHLFTVEEVEIMSVTGDVRTTAFLPTWGGMTFRDALIHVGGRKPGSTGRAVYLTRDGVKRFFNSIEALDFEATPKAGDVLTLSADL
jgi:protein involved in polysaccharide export with SLBB domain